jgi:hypothetical protein
MIEVEFLKGQLRIAMKKHHQTFLYSLKAPKKLESALVSVKQITNNLRKPFEFSTRTF